VIDEKWFPGLDPSIGSQFIRCIVMAMAETETTNTRRMTMQKKVGKDDWVAMFRDIGITDEAMMKWHHLFEARHPESHGDFLTWLGIPSDDIKEIRAKCR